MNTQEALAKIRGDADLSKQFLNDPKGTLESLGVDTSAIAAKAAGGGATADSTCVNIGQCGACVSHG